MALRYNHIGRRIPPINRLAAIAISRLRASVASWNVAFHQSFQKFLTISLTYEIMGRQVFPYLSMAMYVLGRNKAGHGAIHRWSA